MSFDKNGVGWLGCLNIVSSPGHAQVLSRSGLGLVRLVTRLAKALCVKLVTRLARSRTRMVKVSVRSLTIKLNPFYGNFRLCFYNKITLLKKCLT